MKESEIMKIRNLGKKSLKEVIDKVKSMGLSFKAEE
jgi:DNA-directed RNA polymerase alpha subunit